MLTMLKIFICIAAVAVGFPLWFPVLMSLFGITLGLFWGLVGTTIGLMSAFFALAIVGGVMTFIFALPALMLLAVLAFFIAFKPKRLPTGG